MKSAARREAICAFAQAEWRRERPNTAWRYEFVPGSISPCASTKIAQ